MIRFYNALRVRLERRAVIEQLHRLNDHALNDIGVSRYQIETAVVTGRL